MHYVNHVIVSNTVPPVSTAAVSWRSGPSWQLPAARIHTPPSGSTGGTLLTFLTLQVRTVLNFMGTVLTFFTFQKESERDTSHLLKFSEEIRWGQLSSFEQNKGGSVQKVRSVPTKNAKKVRTVPAKLRLDRPAVCSGMALAHCLFAH